MKIIPSNIHWLKGNIHTTCIIRILVRVIDTCTQHLIDGCGLDCTYRSQIRNICELQPVCIHIGCHVQCMRLFCCELMTFLMDHDHDVFDKNDMLLILFSRVRNGWHKEAAGQPAEALKQIRMINTYLFLWLCITNKCMCCLNKSNWSPISCPMLRGVRIGRNDVCLPDKTRKGRQVVADNMNEWHCTGFKIIAWMLLRKRC